MKFFLLIVKNLRRNLLRTALTSLAIMVLVILVTLIWTMVWMLGLITEDKAKDFKLIVTEKWKVPSQMVPTHADLLDPASPKCILPKELGIEPKDFMTWSFYGGTTDPAKMTRDSFLFFFVLDPHKIRTMMDGLEDLDPKLVERMARQPNAVLMGRGRMETLHKRVGDRFTVTGMNYKGIDLDFEIVGELANTYDQLAFMNKSYLDEALDNYPKANNNKPHPLADKRLNLIWLRVRDKPTFAQVADLIENGLPTSSPGVRRKVLIDPEVKCETFSSGVASFLDAYRDLFWAVKWVLVPAILAVMTLVIANAISISVRERRTEMAVLKVLGFRPGQVMTLVLGEALLVGGLSGFLAAGATYAWIDHVKGGLKFPIAFFQVFIIPIHALWWGPALGTGTALLGSILPAWSARTVKVSEVFSKVA
jgi:putative ABC transport system permease protein